MHNTNVARCIADGEFSVYYQPRFSVGTGMCVSAEALVRWLARPGTMPSAFIPDMERNGQIEAITMFVVDSVCKDVGRVRAAIMDCPKISINIAPVLFCDTSFVSRLQETIESHGIPPSMIEFEITESSILHDFEAIISSAAWLRAAGFDLALDDFGTGLSGLHCLDLLPATTIKIDRHFIGGIGVRNTSDHIVASMVRLAKSMGMCAVAEGVETRAQLDYVTHLGYDEVQGFLLARPMPLSHFVEFLLAPPTPHLSAARSQPHTPVQEDC